MNHIHVSAVLTHIAQTVPADQLQQPDLLSLIQQLLNKAEQLMPQCATRQLANMVWAASKLAVEPSIKWQQTFWRVSFAKLPDYEPQHFSNTAMAVAQLGWRPGTKWRRQFLRVRGMEPHASMHGIAPCNNIECY